MLVQPGKVLYVVSDGRGETGTAVLKAALVQFSGEQYKIACESNVRTVSEVEGIVQDALASQSIIFYTLVMPNIRTAMHNAAKRHGVPAIDILGPGLSALHDLFRRNPTAKPGLLYASEREQFDRHDAIDYTLKHDDGKRLDGLALADVVLVGVSRTGKSSTCFYLAYQGVKAANVPLVYGDPLPKELEKVPLKKVVALVVNPKRLVIIREARAPNLGITSHSTYTDYSAVCKEARETYHIISDHQWKSIDVSYMAIEEVAHEVLRYIGRNERTPE